MGLWHYGALQKVGGMSGVAIEYRPDHFPEYFNRQFARPASRVEQCHTSTFYRSGQRALKRLPVNGLSGVQVNALCGEQWLKLAHQFVRHSRGLMNLRDPG